MKQIINTKLYLLCLLFFGIIACNEDYTEPFYEDQLEDLDKIVPPGDKYNEEGEACLNVVYFIPKDLDSIPDWHRRLSGVTKHTQSYFKNSFDRFGVAETSFNLAINEKNPDFVDIIYIKADFALENDAVITERDKTLSIVTSIKKYFKENPERMRSKHTLVYLPNASIEGFGVSANNGVYARFDDDDSKIDDMGFALLAVDRIDFDMNYWGTNIGIGFLKDIGKLIHDLGHAFWLQHNDTPFLEHVINEDTTAIYGGIISMMGSSGAANYSDLHEMIKFSQSDISWMKELDVFRATNLENKFNLAPVVTIQDTSFSFNSETDTLVFNCQFSSSLNPIGMIVYNDPWTSENENDDKDSHTYTEEDAITWFIPEVKEENGIYAANLAMDWKDFTKKGNDFVTKGEIRIRILFEGGVSYPVVMHKGTVKGGEDVRFAYNIQQGIPIFDPILE